MTGEAPNRAAPPGGAGAAPAPASLPPGRSALRLVYRIFTWGTLALLILTIALALRKSPPPRIQSDPQAAERLQAKLGELRQAREAGQPYTLRMQEAELNGWLSSNLALTPSPDTQPRPQAGPQAEPTIEQVASNVRDVKIALVEDRVRAYLVFDFHGKELSLELEGRLAARNGFLRFEPLGGKFGSLPLPDSALRNAVERLVDSPENRDNFKLPPEIADVRVANGELLVSYR